MHESPYGAQRASVELTNICNLHCSYCLRDEDALYHQRANFFSVPLLQKIARDGREAIGLTHISFTGGEPTLHPGFHDAMAAVAGEGLTTSFVTNGWHFERVWPAVHEHREKVTHVSFSVDGATREAHDHWRGEGSFVRLVQAISRCRWGDVPFHLKVGIRKDTVPHLEEIAVFAARMGASGLAFAHLLPTSEGIEKDLALTREEQAIADREVAELARIFKMRVSLDVGYYNIDATRPPCSPLAGHSCNIDYRGYLTLCCNLSGYRGAVGEADVAADLNQEDFAVGYRRLRSVADRQLETWRATLGEYQARGERPDLPVGSPCLFCLQTFAKAPWQNPQAGAGERRALPVFNRIPA
jgi:MoaA/NifB/PqqE/SkfB family radical SAM enzyme